MDVGRRTVDRHSGSATGRSHRGASGAARRGHQGAGVVGSGACRLRTMDRRLARRNLRTAMITAIIGLLMFALTFVAAALYV